MTYNIQNNIELVCHEAYGEMPQASENYPEERLDMIIYTTDLAYGIDHHEDENARIYDADMPYYNDQEQNGNDLSMWLFRSGL